MSQVLANRGMGWENASTAVFNSSGGESVTVVATAKGMVVVMTLYLFPEQ